MLCKTNVNKRRDSRKIKRKWVEIMAINKTVNLNVRITPKVKEQIDAYCEKNDMRASEFVRQAIMKALEEKKDN